MSDQDVHILVATLGLWLGEVQRTLRTLSGQVEALQQTLEMIRDHTNGEDRMP